MTDNHSGFWVDLEIVRNGETFLVIDNLGKQTGRIGRFEKRPATLENGMLKLGGACSIVYVEASGRLIASGCGGDTYEYERSR